MIEFLLESVGVHHHVNTCMLFTKSSNNVVQIVVMYSYLDIVCCHSIIPFTVPLFHYTHYTFPIVSPPTYLVYLLATEKLIVLC